MHSFCRLLPLAHMLSFCRATAAHATCKVVFALEALAKGLYERLFLWLVLKINQVRTRALFGSLVCHTTTRGHCLL
jgi:hypothetical protein